MVKQIASKYLESGSEYIDWNKYVEFEKELIDYLFGNFSNISPKHQQVIDDMISDLNSFEVK